MPLLRSYTYIQDVVIGGGGTTVVAHNAQTNSGIVVGEQQLVLTPVDANGVGCYATAVAGDSFTLNGTPTGTVRVQVQAVHSVQR